MGKRHHSGKKVYADREDELHDPDGKTTRLTTWTRTLRNTDNPLQASIVGRAPRPHLHPKRTRPLPKYSPYIPAVRPTQQTPPPHEAPISGDLASGVAVDTGAEVGGGKAKGLSNTAKMKLARKTKTAEREERRKSHIRGAVLPGGNTEGVGYSTPLTCKKEHIPYMNGSRWSSRIYGHDLGELRKSNCQPFSPQDSTNSTSFCAEFFPLFYPSGDGIPLTSFHPQGLISSREQMLRLLQRDLYYIYCHPGQTS